MYAHIYFHQFIVIMGQVIVFIQPKYYFSAELNVKNESLLFQVNYYVLLIYINSIQNKHISLNLYEPNKC